MATVLTPAEIKQKIEDWITTNGSHEITGAHLNTILAAIMDYVGVGYALRDTAPASAPSPDVPSAYLAGPGTYTNYESGDTVIPEGSLAILKYDGSAWSKSVIKVCDPVSDAVAYVDMEELVASGVLQFEQGSFNSDGTKQVTDTRVRTLNPITTPLTIKVVEGWKVYEVYYYSSWTSDTEFVLDSMRVLNTNGPVRLYKENCVVGFSIRKTTDTIITAEDFILDNLPINKNIDVLDGRYKLDELALHNEIGFEIGGFNTNGTKDTATNRIRTINPIQLQNNSMVISVRGDWEINEVMYYSSWTSDTEFTKKFSEMVQRKIYRFKPISPFVAISFRRPNDSTVILSDFETDNIIVKKQLTQLSSDVSQTVRTTEQSLCEHQQDVVRININASKRNVELIPSQGLIFIDDADGVSTDVSVNIMTSQNVFNKNGCKDGYRLDDNGQEVGDSTESYTKHYFIPVYGGVKVIANSSIVEITKFYLYDVNKTFIARVGYGTQPNTVYTVPTTYHDTPVGYIQMQFKRSSNKETAMVAMSSSDATPTLSSEYVSFETIISRAIISNSAIWKDDFSAFNIQKEVYALPSSIINIPLFSDINPWEPQNADSGYSNPSSGWGQDTKRADWTATDKYLYYAFLEHYYDTYLGVYNNGDYKVTKKGLWQDGAHTGHEIFEYDFCPKNYKYIVMLSAGMNADETQGIWGLATFIRALMGEEETNMSIMKQNIRFKVIPIINASGFDQATLRYTYSNGVNPNFNFNFKDSWERHDVSTTEKGEYPDSNYETVKLKEWINSYSGKAVLWLDLHTGRWYNAETPTNKTIVDARFSSTSSYFNDFNSIHMPLIQNFYITKGTITALDSIGGANSVRNNLDYQKHRYALDICGINSAMPEMHIESTGYGADGYTNNSVDGIKCYVLQVRQLIMYVINKYIADKVSSYNLPDLDKFLFRN